MKYKKLKCVVYAPIDTYSGYGSRGRDFIKALQEIRGEEWDIKILSCRWGATRQGFLDDFKEEWGWMKDMVIPDMRLHYQPDIMFWITVPNEAQPHGKWNCIVTAGIETTACAPQWIEGINRNDLTITSSKHSLDIFTNTKFDQKDQTGQRVKIIEVEKPIEVLFEGVDLTKYKPLKSKEFKNLNLYNKINSISEGFAYLFVGAWLQGELGEDRKNVALVVKAFYEKFKNTNNPPALILKTHGSSSSYMDRRIIQDKINLIKREVKNSKTLPSIYILHGDFSDKEINELYNHPKVKSMINLTKGEGFGRPLLEFSAIGKPIISTNWSGHVDFLNGEFVALCGGNLSPVHPSAQVKDIIIEGSKWFQPDSIHVNHFLEDVKDNYNKWLNKSQQQKQYVEKNFSFGAMKSSLDIILSKHVPDLPREVKLELPKIKKIQMPKKPQING